MTRCKPVHISKLQGQGKYLTLYLLVTIAMVHL